MCVDLSNLTKTAVDQSKNKVLLSNKPLQFRHMYYVSDGSLVINGKSNIIKQDMSVSNGVAHIIDTVLLPMDIYVSITDPSFLYFDTL